MDFSYNFEGIIKGVDETNVFLTISYDAVICFSFLKTAYANNMVKIPSDISIHKTAEKIRNIHDQWWTGETNGKRKSLIIFVEISWMYNVRDI